VPDFEPHKNAKYPRNTSLYDPSDPQIYPLVSTKTRKFIDDPPARHKSCRTSSIWPPPSFSRMNLCRVIDAPSKLKVCKCSQTSFNKTDATNRSKRQSTGELICPTGKISLHAKTCPSLRAKIFRFAFAPNQTYSFPRPGPQEGRIAIVTDVGQGMRWTRQRQAQFLRGRMMLRRTAKSCGSGAPTQALKVAGLNESDDRRWQPSDGHREATVFLK
jgi:hypothetical protein